MTNRIFIPFIVVPLFVIISSITSVQSASAAAVEGWVRVYDGGSDSAGRVAIDGNGNVVVSGNSAWDFYTAKYSGIDGSLLWERRHDGSVDTADSETDMALDTSGNVVVTGTSSNQWYTAKYAAVNGALLWEKRFGVWEPPLSGHPRALAVDNSGNAIVTGVSAGDIYTAKYAAKDGTLLWEKLFSTGLGHDQANDVAVDSSGNVILTGSANRAPTDADYYTAKYAAANGALLWERRYNGVGNTDDSATAIALDAVGNVAVTGASGRDSYTAKYAATTGALLWEKRYVRQRSGYERATAVVADRHGNVVVTGYSLNTNADFYTAKHAAADGTLLWEKRYNGAENAADQPNALALDWNDNVVVTGYTDESGDPYVVKGDFYTAKYAAADGALLWERRYNGSANGSDSASRVAIGHNGMIVVAGPANMNESQGSGDYATIAYWEDLSPLVINVTSSDVQLHLRGVPGRSYEVQRTGNMFGPWTTIATMTAPSQGLIEYVDVNRPSGSAFYRVRTE
jgi:hypothetical protein